MKKILLILGFMSLLSLFNSSTINAEQGTCIIKQLSNTYEVETPFYWYIVTKRNTVNNLMQNDVAYTHNTTYIDTATKCTNITGSLPSHEIDSNNILNTTTKTFYYSKNKLTSSQSIYERAISTFKSSGNKDLTITTIFLSLDNLPPVISSDGINPIIVTTPEHVINANYLKTKISAYDEIDGPITVRIHEDNYSENCKILGSYTITFSASDYSSNTAYVTFTIEVKDTTKPTIKGDATLTSNMSNPLTIKQIKESLTVEDNYYQISNSSILIVKDNFTYNEQKEGNYSISFTVSDPSENISDEFTVNVTTYDDIPPTIHGEQSYEISYKKLLDLSQISNNLVVKDNIDELPKIEILTDNYSDFYYKVGIYQVSYIAKDKNNNTSSPYTININVKDLTKPTIYISKKFIGIDGNALINIDDVIEIIESNNNISNTNLTSFNIIKDEYSKNKNIPGKYVVELYYEYENGESINIETIVIVDNYSSPKEEQIKSTPKKTFWSTLKIILLQLWSYIKYIFSFRWLKELI